jgi:very-short-patch-repair endonuclease
MRVPRDKVLIERAQLMRNAPTDAERKLWHSLRDRRLAGAKFTRQMAVAEYIADFACREHRVIVELDGGGHDAAYDAARDLRLRGLGYRVLRFANAEVYRNLPSLLETIVDQLGAPIPPPGPAQERRLSAPLPGGEGVD